jgi:hypothetical protein
VSRQAALRRTNVWYIVEGDRLVIVLAASASGGDDLSAACELVWRRLAQGRPIELQCDVAGEAPDMATVDALARMALSARRLGCSIVLRHASGELRTLLELTGLEGTLPCA